MLKRMNALKTLSTMLACLMLFIGLAPRSMAGMAASQPGSADLQVSRDADLATVRHALEMKLVQARLVKLGYQPSEVASRVDRLSDADMHQLALQMDDAQTAGFGGIAVFLVIALIVAAIIGFTFFNGMEASGF